MKVEYAHRSLELKAVSLCCPGTDISPKYDKLTNGRTGHICNIFRHTKVHLGLLIKQPLGDVHKWRK